MNVEILEQVSQTTKRGEKERYLARADSDLQHFVKLALDQDVTFGVTVGDDEFVAKQWTVANTGGNAGRAQTLGAWVPWLKRSLEKFQKRESTGNAANELCTELLTRAPSSLHAKWAARIINRNLRAGFDIRTFNKVFGAGSVKKFEVQLAETYDPEKHELQGLWFFQPKLDGNRVTMIDGKAMSRGNREYVIARPFVEAILKKDPKFFDKWVIDGEMMGNLGFDQSSGALRRSSGKGKKADFTYWAFDLVDRKEWDARLTRHLLDRRKDLRETIAKLSIKNICEVPWQQIYDPTPAQIFEICDEYVALGFEGAMAKDAMSGYLWKRGDNLLKIKKFFDADLKIDGFYEGKGQHKGSLGGIWVVGEINGRPVRSKCGSGFGHKFDPKNPGKVLRQDVWYHQKEWRGAVAQIKYQEHTKDGSLRFPVFIMRRKDKE